MVKTSNKLNKIKLKKPNSRIFKDGSLN